MRKKPVKGGQWLSGRVPDLRRSGGGFEPRRRHCVVSLSKNISPSLVLVKPRKTRPFITERWLMGRKESSQTKQTCLADSKKRQTIEFLFMTDFFFKKNPHFPHFPIFLNISCTYQNHCMCFISCEHV